MGGYSNPNPEGCTISTTDPALVRKLILCTKTHFAGSSSTAGTDNLVPLSRRYLKRNVRLIRRFRYPLLKAIESVAWKSLEWNRMPRFCL